MKFIRDNWYWLVVLLPAFIVTENLAGLLAGMHYGHESFATALRTAVELHLDGIFRDDLFDYCFSLLLFLWIRGIPYAAAALFCCVAGYWVKAAWMPPVILGAWIGTWWYTIPNMMEVFRPLYTDERTSSTATIAFLFIPQYAVPYTLGGASVGLLFALLLATVLRRPFTKKRTLPRHQV